MNLKIRNENIKNKSPATAAIIISRPAATFFGSPPEVNTLIAPITIIIRAIAPARLAPIVRIFWANGPSSGLRSPSAVGHVSSLVIFPSPFGGGYVSHGFSPETSTGGGCPSVTVTVIGLSQGEPLLDINKGGATDPASAPLTATPL